MIRRTETIHLPRVAPGTARGFPVHRWGQAGGPKAVLQASLHADELPGQLVLHHLMPKLDAAAEAGAIRGEIVVVPFANPAGLAQSAWGRHHGRHDFETIANFNRHYPDLTDAVAARIAGRLGDDAAANVALIREGLRAEIAELRPRTEADALRVALMGIAADADVLLDLHCDETGLLYLYTGAHLWPAAADLVADLGCHAALLSDDSGGNPFDETLGGIYWRLRDRFPGKPIPSACLAATIELRGQADVDDALARRDADALFRFLVRRGFVAGDPGPLPPPFCEGTPFEAVDVLESPSAGLIVWRRRLGERVAKGEVVADILDLSEGPNGTLAPVAARTDGILFTRVLHPLARPGTKIAKIAGREKLPWRTGYLLED